MDDATSTDDASPILHPLRCRVRSRAGPGSRIALSHGPLDIAKANRSTSGRFERRVPGDGDEFGHDDSLSA